MMHFTPKVIHRVEPRFHEDLTGYLMRVATRNHMKGPADLLAVITGSESRSVHLKDLPLIGALCRISDEEVCQLSGYEWRIDGLERRWHIHDEWLTKAVFVSLRQAKVCPACIQAANYVRGEWSLSFYNVCALHQIRLTYKCPACSKAILWSRRYPHRCSCGFHLGDSPATKPLPYESALSCLLLYRILGEPSLLKGLPIADKTTERLAGLSLDGICKIFWFLGHNVAELGSYGSGHGRKRPGGFQIELMAEHAFSLLSDWPKFMGNWLEQFVASRLPAKFSATAFDHLLAPLHNYFTVDSVDPEMTFLVAALEQHLKRIWLLFGQRHYNSRFEYQMELMFETDG
jgi:hypothetical protein